MLVSIYFEGEDINNISVVILDSLKSNDNQIRIFIDYKDILEERLGIDPPDFIRINNELFDNTLLIGRCECGTYGCDDLYVKSEKKDKHIKWTFENGDEYYFDIENYKNVCEYIINDKKWENIKRRVERKLNELLKGKVLRKEYIFTWASTRINKQKITLSFVKSDEIKIKYDQKMIEIDWDEQN